MSICLSDLGFDILNLYVIPHLNRFDQLSLASTNRTISNLLNGIRIPTAAVSNGRGFILDVLSPSTIQAIKHITINGTVTENSLVFASTNLTCIQSITIQSRLTSSQGAVFQQFTKRITSLTEEVDLDGDGELVSSLSGMPDGIFESLQSLRLEISLPYNLASQLGRATNLTILQYFPGINPLTPREYKAFANSMILLFGLLSDSVKLPSLRLVHAVLAKVYVPSEQSIRNQVLEAMWRAAAKHGGWRLLARKPSGGIVNKFPAAWETWWANRASHFYLSVNELQNFALWCTTQNRFPRLGDFVSGRIHLEVHGDEETLKTEGQTKIYGVSINAKATVNLSESLQVLTKDTKALAITLESGWGEETTSGLFPWDKFRCVEALIIHGPSARHQIPHLYASNISRTLVQSLSIKHWQCLINLSLPAAAFQAPPTAHSVESAACTIDIGAYDLSWLKECVSLRAIHFTEWAACHQCLLQDNATLEGGLAHLPPSVEFVFLGGHFRCPEAERAQWVEFLRCNVIRGLKEKLNVICVSLRCLRIGLY